MAEYIDRAKLIERIEYYLMHTGGEAHYAYSVMLREIRAYLKSRLRTS